MNKKLLGADGYPNRGCLREISSWPHEDGIGWFDFIFSLWSYTAESWEKDDRATDENGNEVIRFSISTFGWSGNEMLIQAMQKNYMLWNLNWVQSRRGGHHIFEVRKRQGVKI